jgi:hypothetical protein
LRSRASIKLAENSELHTFDGGTVKHRLQSILAAVALLGSGAAIANFHLYQVEQLYSNADGSVQFLVLHQTPPTNGENLLQGHTLTSSQGGVTQTYFFPNDLPGSDNSCDPYGYGYMCGSAPTANKRVLIATQGFAALGVVTPDYTVPNGFFPTAVSAAHPGVINYAENSAIFAYSSLPTDGVNAMGGNGAVVANVATNYAGQKASVTPAPPPPTVFGNFQGLWWNDPDNSESGWGINFNHQGDTIFATWFTFGLAGQPLWLVATLTSTPAAPNVFSGNFVAFSGSRFDAFDQTKVLSSQQGTGTVTFSDLDHARFDYTVAGQPQQTKQIKREPLNASPMASCNWGAQSNLALATNYQDLWYAFPADSEKGWGVNFTHQGNTIFATWFTYGVDGQPMWLVAAIANTPAQPNVYTGSLTKAVSGPSFNAVPFDFNMVKGTAAGTLTVTFADGNRATFDYSVDAVNQTKQITRDVFAQPGTMCQ